MKRKFTKLAAALALLAFLIPPAAGWGQTTHTSSLIFTAACGGSGTADDNVQWTVTSDGTESTFDNTKGIHYGTSSAAVQYIRLNTSGISGTITKIVVNASTASGVSATVGVTVGGSAFGGDPQSTTTTATDYTFNGSASGEIVVTHTKPSSATKALYVKSVVVTYATGGDTPTPTTYTVTYDCNGGTSGCPENVTDIEAGTSITLASAPTKTDYIFNGWNDGTNTYEAGASYTVNGNVTFTAQWQLDADYLFYESFNTNNGTGGNDNQWSGSIASSALNSDNTDWTFANGNGANKCAKFGTSSKKGSAQTPAISHTGNATLTFKAAAWNGNSENTTLKLSATSGNLSASTVTLTKGAWTDYTIEITNISTSTQITFEGNAASNSRFFLDEVMVVEAAPSTDPFITAENVEIAYNATSGSIMAEIGNYAAGTLDPSTEAEWITNFTVEQDDETIEIDFTTTENNTLYARTATVNLTYTYGDYQTATANVTVTQNGNSNLPGGQGNPYTVAQAIEATPETGESGFVYVHGIVSEIVEEYSSQYHNISYNISDDGTTTSAQLEAFRGKGLNNENFTSDQDILPGDAVTIYGKLTYYNNAIYELAAGNYLVSFERPVVPTITVVPNPLEVNAEEHTGSFTVTYTEIETSLSASIYWYTDATGSNTTDEPAWISAEINETTLNVDYIIAANEGEARTAYFKVYGVDGEANDVYSTPVTINQAAYVAPVTSGTGTITFGSAEGSKKIDNASVTEDDSLGNTWTIATIFGSAGESFTQNANYSQVGSSGKPATSITFTMTLPNEATISAFEAKFGGFNGTEGTVTLLVGENTVGTGSLNGTSDVTVSSLPMVTGTVLTVTVTDIAKGVKCYYISYTLGAETYTLTINGYGESDGGYYLIASPVTVDLNNHAMTTGDFDLYYFDQNEEDEWRNYEAGAFNLEPGKGYLYAHKNGGEFTLTGAPYTGNGEVELTYIEGKDFAGWNLIGNPYATAATLDKPFYRLSNGSEVSSSTEEGTVNAMEGVFVVAETNGDIATFSTSNNAKAVEQVVMNLSKVNRGSAAVIDNAIVRFDEGQQLPKFQLNPNNTKIYVAQGNKDYAIVRSAAEGEMPVSFKANENGTYTLSVEAENVEMNYLHFIDNMTGADVDLLATPSYSFEARTSDYTSRFRLVFSASQVPEPVEGPSAFAFFNGSSWTVSNMGEATLQVVDMMGRVLSSQTLSGNADLNVNQPAGVYMLRLVNGNDVKVQKVVVR